MIFKKVKQISHDWIVKKTKIIGKVKYYLLEDSLNADVFLVAKESLDPNENFSGRIKEIEDVEKKFTVIKDKMVMKSTGWSLTEMEEEVPYIHKIWDFAKATIAEAQDVFSNKLLPATIETESGEKSLVFTVKKPVKEKPVIKKK